MHGQPPTDLAALLGLAEPSLVALVGSGGKTTLLKLLARELVSRGSPVIVGATTHMYPPQAGEASDLWLLGNYVPDPDQVRERLRPERPLWAAGGHTLDGKLRGVSPEQAEALAASGAWVLLEADGSARLPLKAWAPWEPVLPRGAHTLAAVVGASGLGRPLDQRWVHRPDLFARASGLAPGAEITPQAMARALLGPQGPSARAGRPADALVINQADAVAAKSLAELGRALHAMNQSAGRTGFRRLLAGSLRWGRLRPL